MSGLLEGTGEIIRRLQCRFEHRLLRRIHPELRRTQAALVSEQQPSRGRVITRSHGGKLRGSSSERKAPLPYKRGGLVTTLVIEKG